MQDLISRQAAIDAIENTDWYHQNDNGDMVSGASNEHQAWYKADDVYSALESVPSAQPTVNTARHGQEDTDMKTDLYLVNISYIKAIDIIENSNESTDEQIMISAIYKILRMETTNAVTKDVLKKAVNYLFNKMYSIED